MQRIILFIIFISFSFIEFLQADPRKNSYGIVEEDIPYASEAEGVSKRQLDLYLPHVANFPVVLFIHGGSFVSGDRKEFPYAQIGETFQRNGVGCAVMSYRLMRDSIWPAQPNDVASAVHWIKTNIKKYGGNEKKIFIVGHSAGGHLAALVCTDSTYFVTHGVSLSDISGCVAIGAMMSDGGSVEHLPDVELKKIFTENWFFKIFGSKEHFLQSLPLNHVSTSMPPMLLLLGDQELFDPPKLKTVQEFVVKASRVHAKASYGILHNRTHMGVVEHMIDDNDLSFKTILSFMRDSSAATP